MAWFREREHPATDWKVGIEFEALAQVAGTLDPVPYDGPRGIEAVLRAYSRWGYEPFEENGRAIADPEGRPDRLHRAGRAGGAVGAAVPGRARGGRGARPAPGDRAHHRRRAGGRVPGRRLPPLGNAGDGAVGSQGALRGDAPVPLRPGAPGAGHDVDDRLGAGLLRLRKRAGRRREAAGRAGRPAGGGGPLRQLPGGPGRGLGLAELPHRGLEPHRPGPLRDPPLRLRAGLRGGGLPALRRVGPRRAHGLPAPRGALPRHRRDLLPPLSSRRGCTATRPPWPTGRTSSRCSSPRSA